MFICTLFFTLISALPISEKIAPDELSISPQAAGICLFSAYASLFSTGLGLLALFRAKKSVKPLLLLFVLCMLVSGYRILAINQYTDQCQYVESSVCMVGKSKPLPLW